MSEKKNSTLGESGIYDAKTLGAPKVTVLGLQHMFAMFGSTILVPLLLSLEAILQSLPTVRQIFCLMPALVLLAQVCCISYFLY